MREALVAYAPRLDPEAEALLCRRVDGKPTVERCLLRELAERADLGEELLILVIPGEEALRFRVQLPASGRKAQQGIPWLIEERLVAPVEDDHVCWQRVPGAEGHAFDALTCDAGWLAEQTAALADMGLTRVRLTPLHALAELPPADGEGQVTKVLGVRLAAEPAGSGILPKALGAARAGRSVVRKDFPGWLLDHAPGAAGIVIEPSRKPLEFSPWLSAAAVLLWTGLLLALLYHGHRLDTQARSLEAGNFTQVSELLPEARRGGDLAAQLRSQLAAEGRAGPGKAGPKALPYLNRAAQLIADSGQGFTVHSLRLQGAEAILTLELANLDAAPALRSFLEERGLAVEIRSMRASGAQALAELVLDLGA